MSAEQVSSPVVLLVDDDPDLLELGQTILELAGMRVVTSPDGRRALEMLDLVKPAVIVLDMMMPVLDGLGFLREYAFRPPPRPPVIAVSAFRAYVDEARTLGVAATLKKPYDANELTALVQELARGRQVDQAPAPSVAFENEQARVRALLDLQLDEPAPEPGMQRFLDEVAHVFGVPVAGISAVTADRQQLVTHCSALSHDDGGPREQAFCTHAVAARAALVIQDAADNPFFRDNPTVTVRGFRFYAGVPLIAARGEAVGTLCILDFESHPFMHADLELLGLFARRVLAALEWRDKRRHPERPDSVYSHLQQFDEELDIYGKQLFADLVVVEASRGLSRGQPSALFAVGVHDGRLSDTVAALRDVANGESLIGRLGTNRLGVIIPGRRACEIEEPIRRACGSRVVLASTDLERYQGGSSGLALVHLEQTLDAAAA